MYEKIRRGSHWRFMVSCIGRTEENGDNYEKNRESLFVNTW